MKTDAQLYKDVVDELGWDPRVKGLDLVAHVEDGVVTLTGTVPTLAQKFAAESATMRLEGVRAVVADIDVKPPENLARPDTDLAHAVVETLRWDVDVPDEHMRVMVAGGWVTLTGEVEWRYQKDAAARAIRKLAGVRGVTNELHIAPRHPAPDDVGQRIENALRRHAEREARRIAVETVGDVVTLRGTVPSLAARRAAEGAAWSVPGVQDVIDELVVAG
jgi:osmotically-inducible protein OsmY